MTPEREAELFAKLDLLMDLVRGVDGSVRQLDSRVSRLEGRVEEQSKFLQLALAGRQPRPAAE